jgi:hypothetical protein
MLGIEKIVLDLEKSVVKAWFYWEKSVVLRGIIGRKV